MRLFVYKCYTCILSHTVRPYRSIFTIVTSSTLLGQTFLLAPSVIPYSGNSTASFSSICTQSLCLRSLSLRLSPQQLLHLLLMLLFRDPPPRQIRRMLLRLRRQMQLMSLRTSPLLLLLDPLHLLPLQQRLLQPPLSCQRRFRI